jgi:hypothetical protein
MWVAQRHDRSMRSRVWRAVDDVGGDVQDAVAERGDLAAGQFRDVGEGDDLGPGDQVGGGQDDLEPGGVLVPRPACYLESLPACT